MTDRYGATPTDNVDVEPRCWRCGRMLARVLTRPWLIECGKCKARNSGGPADEIDGLRRMLAFHHAKNAPAPRLGGGSARGRGRSG